MPLDLAVTVGSKELLELFARHRGVFYETHTNPQETALLYASLDADACLSTILLAEQLSVKRCFFKDGKVEYHAWGSPEWPGTPLNIQALAEVAAEHGCKKSLRVLMNNGFTIDGASAKMEAMFFRAVATGDTEFVELLLEAGVEVNAFTSSGSTALVMAVQQGFETLCSCLIRHGADVNASFVDGPAHVAAFNGRCAILQVLRAAGGDMAKKKPCGSDTARYGLQRKSGKSAEDVGIEL